MARTIKISGKCSDMCDTRVPHLRLDKDGYVPYIPGVGGGDYISVEIDLDTGKVVGFPTDLTDEKVAAILKGDE